MNRAVRLLAVCVAVCLAARAGAQVPAPESVPIGEAYRAAHDAIARHDLEAANTAYRAFLREALHRAANAKAAAGDLAEAAAEFERVLQLGPADQALRADFASLRLDQGFYSEAEKLLEASGASDARSQYLLGRALFEQDKYPAAKPHLESAYSAGTEDAWFLLAVTELKLQQLSPARNLMATVLKRLGDNARTHFRFGVAYYEGDYPDEAITEFQIAIKADPQAADQHYYLGLAYLGHNPDAGFERAEPEFRAELQIAPRDFRSHYMLGYIAFKRHRLPEAEQELKTALQLNPDDANTMLLLAQLSEATGQQKEEESLLRRALASYRQQAIESYEVVSAHYMLGRLLQRAGRSDDATAELRQSEELRAKLRAVAGATPEERASMAPAAKATSTLHTPSPEDRARATAYLDQMGPSIAEAYNNLGAIAAEQSNFPMALEYFERAGAWQPDLQGLDRNVGRAAFLAHRYEVAIPALQKYVQSHPDDAWAKQALDQSLQAQKQK